MKLLIISDIHSNIDNLKAVLEAEHDADLIYCAGDLVDVGFHPCEVIDCVRAHAIPCVQGNHDVNVVELWQQGIDVHQCPNDFLQLNAQLLDDEHISYLRSLPERLTFSHDGVSYLMQHRYKGYELLGSDYEFDALWGDAPVDLQASHRCIILGHTHHQIVGWLAEDRCWINPGSIGYNRDDDPFPGTRYLTIVDGQVTFHRLEHPSWQSRLEMSDIFKRRYPGSVDRHRNLG